MKLTRRGPAAADVPVAVSGGVETDADGAPDSTAGGTAVGAAGRKGRPTPKRRDAEGRRGPVTAPRTRKEAMARQRQLAREEKAARRSSRSSTASRPTSLAEQRAAVRRGDESALPRRDKGPTRRLARNYVDSHRMFSNYLLWLFPLMIAASFIKTLGILQIVIILVFLALLVEWYLVGRRIRAMALERFGSADGSAMGIGFYAGSRAYLPRKWRMPAPQVQLGDEI